MHLVGLSSLLSPAQEGGYAVGAFNYCNAESGLATVETAAALRSPVLLITGPWETAIMGPRMLVDMADYMASRADVPVCLHLDHASDVGQIKDCVDAGFPSVMMDASGYDFEENVRLTKLVVAMAHTQGVTVEGELGAVGSAHAAALEGPDRVSLTDPDQAAVFVRRTGVDALAVAIGNAHGIYTRPPALDFDRLAAIRGAIGVPLVLHGGSGTPIDQLHRAVELGVTKVNVASELSRAYLDAIRRAVSDNQNVWYARALMDAKAAVAEVVGRWMCDLGCAGRAP